MCASAGATSLNSKWKPNLNLIFADKFLDGRMGIVANLSSAKYNNESHQYTAFANTGSQFHLIDFDNSPEKTFSFQPGSVLPPDSLQSTDVPLRGFARTGTTERPEGRNLGRKANAAYAPQAALESGGAMVNVLNYGGARYLVGLVLRN